MPTALLIPLCVLATSAISGVLGMAGGMILMGVLVSVLPVTTAILIHAIAQFVANGSRALLHRQYVVLQPLRFYAAGMLVAALLMSLISFIPDKATVFFLLGILPFVQLAFANKVKLDIMRPWQGVACGFLSATMHLGGGVAGMLVDVFFQRTGMTRHQIVATKATTQMMAHVVRFAYFSAMAGSFGALGGLSPLDIVIIAAAAVAGTLIAGRVLDKLSDHKFRQLTQYVLLALGAVYLVRALLLYTA